MKPATWIGGALFPVTVLLVGWDASAIPSAKAAGAPKIRWVEISSIGVEVVGMKKEIKIDDRTAKKLFAKGPSCLREGWRKEVPEKIENASNARAISKEVKRAWIEAKDATPSARILRFTKKEMVVVVLEPKGRYLWHHFDECLACFRVPRNEEIDTIFDVRSLEQTYGAEYKGLRQGDSAADVKKKLGEPDERITTQAFGFELFRYLKDDVVITVNFGRIERFNFGVPQAIQQKATPSPQQRVGP